MKYQDKFWEKYFHYYDTLLEVIPYQNLFKRIVKKLQIKSKHKILDLGSGTGNLQYFLPENIDCISLDYSNEALIRLKEKFPNSTTFKHPLQERLPFDDNTFDRIVSNNVLYTLAKDEWQFIVSEIKRISKPNAIVVISNLNTNFNAFKIYLDHIKSYIKKSGIVKTLRHLTKLIYPTLQIVRFNKIIKNNNNEGNYYFINSVEQKDIFEQSGLLSVCDSELVYSNQAIMDVFVNKK